MICFFIKKEKNFYFIHNISKPWKEWWPATDKNNNFRYVRSCLFNIICKLQKQHNIIIVPNTEIRFSWGMYLYRSFTHKEYTTTLKIFGSMELLQVLVSSENHTNYLKTNYYPYLT